MVDFLEKSSRVDSVKSSWVDAKANEGRHKSELHDGDDVSEKLLPSHVEPRREHNDWKSQVEENAGTELHILYENGVIVLRSYGKDAPREEDAKTDHNSCVVSISRVEFLKVCFGPKLEEKQEEQNDVENLL